MKLAVAILSFFLFTFNLNADDMQVVQYYNSFPLAVVIEHIPMQASVSSKAPKAPKAVLYDNGNFVYMDKLQNEQISYSVQKFDIIKLQKLIDSIGPTHEFLNLNGYYALADAYDLPTVEIFLSNGHTSKAVSLYGVTDKNGSLSVVCDGGNSKSIIPKEVNRVYSLLMNVHKNNPTRWQPKFIELIIWPYEQSPMKPILWPDDWPSIKHPLSQEREDSSHSLFLSFAMEKELDQFLGKLKERQAILIDNQKWALVKKPAFPNEFIWKHMLEKTDDIKPPKGD